MQDAGPMSTGWYAYKRSAGAQAQTGPHTWEELYGLVRSGALEPEDLVWHPQLPEWRPASQLPGLIEPVTGQTAIRPAATGPAAAATHASPPVDTTAVRLEARPATQVAAEAPRPTAAKTTPPPRRRRWVLPVVAALVVVIIAGGGGAAAWLLTRDGGDDTVAESSTTTHTSAAGGGENQSVTSTETTVDDGVTDLEMAGPTIIDVPFEEVATGLVSAQGATLEYGPVKVEVPAGAVTEDTTVSITRLSEPFHTQPSPSAPADGVEAIPISSAFDFGPAGVTFAKPVTVTLPYDPGIGPDVIDPERVVIAYYNGEQWALAGGTVDPAARTVSVQLEEFEGSLLLAAAIGTGIGLAVNAGIKWYYGPEAVRSDPVSDKNVKDWVTPKDPVIQQQAAKAVIQHPVTKETKPLDDPGLAEWVASICKQGQRPALGYKNADGTVSTSTYDSGEGSSWQKPADYFTKGTKQGPLHGDCTDLTNATVSVLKAGGLPAKGVIGYGGGGANKDSVHAWGEVLIGDGIYRVDEGGSLLTPDNASFEFGEYKPITDPNDPRSLSMWDDEGQKTYSSDWWTEFLEYDINGHWTGTMTFSSITIDTAGMTEEEKEGCDFSFLEELAGKAFPLTMDYVVDEDGNGTCTMLIDLSSLNEGRSEEDGTFNSEPSTAQITYKGNKITFLTEGDSEAQGSMSGTVSKVGNRWVITGTLVSTGEGFSLLADWTVSR